MKQNVEKTLVYSGMLLYSLVVWLLVVWMIAHC